MTTRFAELFGRPPDGVWSAPGRVNLIGEFTDYNEGFVLPTTLPLACRARVARRDDDRLRVASVQHPYAADETVVEARIGELRPQDGSGWSAYALGMAWVLRDAGFTIGGADIELDSDVPIGAGLSSSAALECSVGLALRDLFALDLSRRDLALLAQRAENDYVGVPCGVMDQMASLLCVPGQAMLLDTRSLATRQLPFSLREGDHVLMVLDTRVRHALADSAYAERRQACELAAQRIGVSALRDVSLGELGAALEKCADPVLARRVRHIVTEGARVQEMAALLEAGRIADVGPVLTAGHASLRDDYEVSCPELDAAVDAAMAAGALGARMVGGGFGGSAIALAPAASAPAIAAGLDAAFAASGFAVPHAFVAAPETTSA